MRRPICRRVPRGRPMNTCWPKTPSRTIRNSSGFIPHDPMGDRIRALLGNLVQAKAWHIAVLANSAVGYKSFYEKFSNGPYAQSALKMAAQPKIIPLSQPTRIAGAGFDQARRPRCLEGPFRPHPGRAGLAAGRRPDRHVAVFRLQDHVREEWRRHRQDRHPARRHKADSRQPSAKLASGRLRSWMAKLTQVEKRTSKSSPLVGVHRGPAGIASAGNNQRFATSSQFRGSAGQAPAGRLQDDAVRPEGYSAACSSGATRGRMIWIRVPPPGSESRSSRPPSRLVTML